MDVRRAITASEEVDPMMFWNGNWPVWQVALMWIGMAAFAGLLVWLLFGLGTATNRCAVPHAGDGAQRILAERLARGEIDADEYRQQCATMASDTSHHADAGNRR
jgi:putative membrane protein